jgi:hypothetical protein
LPAPIDTDKDGMPNEWEKSHGLDTADASDRNIYAADGYTMLEKYLNSIEFASKVEGIEFSPTSDSLIQIFWGDSFLDETGYIIERAIPGESFAVLDSVDANTNSLIDSAASALDEYVYRIRAYNDTYESPYSDEVQYTPEFYSCSITLNGQGSVSITPDVSSYLTGTEVTLTATADPGWVFTHWTEDQSGTSNPISFKIESDKAITANFYEIVSVDHISMGAKYRFYPNPVKDKLTIELKNALPQKALIQVYDCVGKLIIQKIIQDSEFMLDLNDLSSGIYWIKLLDGNDSTVIKKIIKQ